MFKKELGTVQGVEAKIYVDTQEKPRYFKSRSPPFALKEKIERELDTLVLERNCNSCRVYRVGNPDCANSEKFSKLDLSQSFKLPARKSSIRSFRP